MANSTTFPSLLVIMINHKSVFILATQVSNTGARELPATCYSTVWAVVSVLCPGCGHFFYHFHGIYCSWHFTRKKYCTEKLQVSSYHLRSYEWGFKSPSKALLCFLHFSLRAVAILLTGKRKEQKFYRIFICFVLGSL